ASILAALVSALVLLLGPAKASATTADECQFDIDLLTVATSNATYLRGDQGLKLESQLLHHLAQATKELSQLDLGSTLRQMDRYSTDLSKGVASGKIDATSAVDLQLGANTVIACVNAIGQ
ncbi:MAG TPA: hypothetical protein VIV57_24675, partial [Anaeromyxobacter sp.]